MAKPKSAIATESEISRDCVAELLNEDLSREYQAIIAYVVYSQVVSAAWRPRRCLRRNQSQGGGRRPRPHGPRVRPRGVTQRHSTDESFEQRRNIVGGE
jgi:hypothetical protein